MLSHCVVGIPHTSSLPHSAARATGAKRLQPLRAARRAFSPCYSLSRSSPTCGSRCAPEGLPNPELPLLLCAWGDTRCCARPLPAAPQASSDVCAAIARDIAGTIGGERDLFTFQRAASGSPLLVGACRRTRAAARALSTPPPPLPVQLVLDRREDPVTPLLSQWTYQAMVHE